MVIQELAFRGTSGRAIARTLEVTEGTIRYHLRRQDVSRLSWKSSGVASAEVMYLLRSPLVKGEHVSTLVLCDTA